MKHNRFLWVAAAMVVSAGAAGAADDRPFFFKEGDRIVFLGDSITEQYQYSTYIELYLTTRYPRWNVTFLNAGIGGDTATGGAMRFESHVLAEKPTALTINFGMNDAGYGAFVPSRNEQYVKNTAAMLEAARKSGVRTALLSPNAVDRRINQRFALYLETQKQFYAPLKELAQRHEAAFVDQYAITRAALEKMEKDSAKNVVPFGDGFHTSPPGGLLMAHAILTGLNAPALVSDVAIDVASSKAKCKRAVVDELQVSAGKVSFRRTDEALPLPIQSTWTSLLPYVNQLKDLNWYGLKVTGLSDESYRLSVDGQEIGAFTAKELAAGINLGNLQKGPLHTHAQKVLDAINSKNRIVHQRFRGVVMFNAPDWLADVAAERKPAELVKRMKAIESRQAEVYKLAEPAAHHFELVAVK